jgi:hypothetical protein
VALDSVGDFRCFGREFQRTVAATSGLRFHGQESHGLSISARVLGQRFEVKSRTRLRWPNPHRPAVFPSHHRDHNRRRSNMQQRQQCNPTRHLGGNKRTLFEECQMTARCAGVWALIGRAGGSTDSAALVSTSKCHSHGNQCPALLLRAIHPARHTRSPRCSSRRQGGVAKSPQRV